MTKRIEMGKTISQIKDERKIGTLEAKRLWEVSYLLHRIEDADNLSELRSLLSEFVSMQTGVQ